jgi:hypothetical protein
MRWWGGSGPAPEWVGGEGGRGRQGMKRLFGGGAAWGFGCMPRRSVNGKLTCVCFACDLAHHDLPTHANI